MNREPARILVIQTAWLGDVVLTTPLFAALKGRWPGARLTALVVPHTAPLLEGLTTVEELLVHDKRRGGWKDLTRMGREVRARRFDLVLSPHRSLRSCWLARRSGAPRRVGYRESAWPGAFTDLVRRPRDGHEIEKVLALLAPLGITPPDNPRPELAVGTAERERARELAGGKPYAVIAPAAAWETKRWLPEGFAAVADHLARARGLRVVLTGAPGDEAAGAAVARAAARAAVTDLVGRTTTREMMALTAEAAVVVANDSAPVHVAAAFDVPTVAVFGATVPTQGFGPRSTRSEVVEVTVLDCRPCGAHGGRKCPVKHFKCMHELEASAVTAAVDRVLARTASP